MLSKLWFFLKTGFLEAASYKFDFIFSVLGIFFSSATIFFIAKLIPGNNVSQLVPYGGDYFSFVIVGLVFSELLNTFETSMPGQIRQAQVSGTLESLFLTQTNIPVVLVGLSLFPFVFSLIRISFYFLLGILFFGIKLRAVNWLAMSLIFVLGSVCFLSIGILSASFIMVYKMGNPINYVFGTISGLLGGVFFPVAVLPPWIKWLSYLFPLTHTLEGARKGLLVSASFSAILPSIMALVVFGVIFFPLSLYVFRIAVRKAKKDGVLAQY